MPSSEHEILVSIVREQPELVLELLGQSVDASDRNTIEVLDRSENLTQIRPSELRADAVLVSRPGVRKRARAAFVVEVQLARDSEKRWSWPSYVAVARARLRCPVTLVVLTTNPATARWAARPIVLDRGPSSLSPHVIGPSAIPAVVGDTARRLPELAVVSVLAHRNEASVVDTARALLAACNDLDPARAKLYADVALGFVNDAARRALEAEMNLENYQPRSEFLRKLEAQAEAHGRLDALVRTLLMVVDTRGLAVTDDQRASILACTEVGTLERWLQRAVAAATADEIFEG